MMRIAFVTRRRADYAGAIEVVPAIDGSELTHLIDAFELAAGMESDGHSYGGLIPSSFQFGSLERHFLGESQIARDGKVPVLGCACGEWGCWPLLARIVVGTDVVRWCDFEQPHRSGRDYSRFGPFELSAAQYQDALKPLCGL